MRTYSGTNGTSAPTQTDQTQPTTACFRFNRNFQWANTLILLIVALYLGLFVLPALHDLVVAARLEREMIREHERVMSGSRSRAIREAARLEMEIEKAHRKVKDN